MRYSNACLGIIVVIVYCFITLLIIGFTISPISHLAELLLMRYRNACQRLVLVILHCLQRFYHNVDHWGIKRSFC